MKKKKSSTRSSAPGGGRTPKGVDDYRERLPEPAFTALSEIREAVRSVVPPDAVEVISYGIPAFKRKKVLVWYAGFAKHCSLFPTAAVIEAFEDELKGFTISKG